MSSTAASILVLVLSLAAGAALALRFFPLRDSVPPLATWTSRLLLVAAAGIAGAAAFDLGDSLKHVSAFGGGQDFSRGTIIATDIERLLLRSAPFVAVAVFVELFARGKIEANEPLKPSTDYWQTDEPT